jgi:hypothetical protein
VKHLPVALLVLLLLGMAASACSGAAKQASPSLRATLRPTFTPAAMAAPQPTVPPQLQESGEGGTLDPQGLWRLEGLTSARLTIRVHISGTKAGEAVDAVLEDVYELAEPGGLHATCSYRGAVLEREVDSELYRLEDGAVYVNYDGEWRRVEAIDHVEGYVGGLEVQDFLRDTCGWRRQTDTEYEGIRVQHWSITTEDMLRCQAANDVTTIGELAAASGNLFIVPEDNYIVHMDLMLEGAQLQTQWTADSVIDTGRFEFAFDISHMNQPLTIQVPAEALSAKGPLNLEGLAYLFQATSYRTREQIGEQGTAAGESLEGAWEGLIEYTTEPQAQHLQGSRRTMDGLVETLDEYQLSDTTYSRAGEGWQQRPRTKQIVPQTGEDPRRLLEGTCGWRQQADVEYRGVLTHHWTMAREDGLDCPPANLLESGSPTGLSGDLLIAAEGSYPLRLEVVVEGTGFDAWLDEDHRVMDEGRRVIVLETWDVNQPFTIEVPTEALSAKKLLNLEGLTGYDQMTSFRASTRLRISGTAEGESLDGEHEYLIEFTSEPRAQHSQVSGRGMRDPAKTVTLDVYALPDTTYTKVDGGWERQPTTEIWIEGDWIDAHGWLEGTCGWEQKADVEYDGIVAHHWTLAKEDGLACPSELTELGNIAAFGGDLFVAAAGNYIRHLELVLEGTDLENWSAYDDPVLDEGRVVIILDVKDVNQPFVIQPPEEAPPGEVAP